jgi:hypothetical protein
MNMTVDTTINERDRFSYEDEHVFIYIYINFMLCIYIVVCTGVRVTNNNGYRSDDWIC